MRLTIMSTLTAPVLITIKKTTQTITIAIKLFILLSYSIHFVCFFTNTSHSVRGQSIGGPCRNPNRNLGECISIYKCDILLNILKRVQERPRSTDAEQLRFISASQCGQNNEPLVCCTSDTSFTSTNSRIPTSTTSKPDSDNSSNPSNGLGSVLPEPPNCGADSFGDKIYSGQETELDQYPWMALLSYRTRNNNIQLKCAGSLINQRYILTAAHCVVGEIQRTVGQLYKIRLGEYNISSEIDCRAGTCNDQVVELDYEEIIPHPDYDPSNKNNHHDISLIRLAKDVNFTYYIKPVCLPLIQTRRTIQPGDLLTVAGWGRTLFSRQSEVKMQLAIPVVDQELCSQTYATRGIRLISKQMCAGGEYTKDSCDGDSGGPLMRKAYQKRWYLEGIVSFGNKCGLQGWAGVYTRVADYVDWIQENLKP